MRISRVTQVINPCFEAGTHHNSHCPAYRETLRRDPVVGAVMRVSTREFTLGDYHVPASQTFLLPLRELAAHDPRWEGKTGETYTWGHRMAWARRIQAAIGQRW